MSSPAMGLTAARGIRVGSCAAGIKSAPDEPDVALIVSDGPAAAAGPGWRRVEIAADVQADTLIALALQLAD